METVDFRSPMVSAGYISPGAVFGLVGFCEAWWCGLVPPLKLDRPVRRVGTKRGVFDPPPVLVGFMDLVFPVCSRFVRRAGKVLHVVASGLSGVSWDPLALAFSVGWRGVLRLRYL